MEIIMLVGGAVVEVEPDFNQENLVKAGGHPAAERERETKSVDACICCVHEMRGA